MNAIVSLSLPLVFVESTALFYLIESIEELEIKVRDGRAVRG
jgi:hypothetical protein